MSELNGVLRSKSWHGWAINFSTGDKQLKKKFKEIIGSQNPHSVNVDYSLTETKLLIAFEFPIKSTRNRW